MSLGSKEVGVPYAQKATKHRDVLLQWCLLEMLVHGLGASKEFMEVVEPDVQGNTQTDRAPHAVATAYPAREAEHVVLVDPELCDLLFVSGECNEVLGNVIIRLSSLQKPRLCSVGISRCLGGGKCLGRNQEQGRLRIGIAQSLGDMRTVDIGYKM